MIHGKYVEVEPVIMRYVPRGINVFYFCGGRGIGKTYGALDFLYGLSTKRVILDPELNKFIYLRRTEVETMCISNAAMQPFKKYNKQEGTNIYGEYKQSVNLGYFYDGNKNDELIGYAASISTFSNLRGVDFSDVICILFDECIPESNKKRNSIKDEGFLLLNILETVNRNRALEGQPEIILIMLSNPIDMGSVLLSQLNLTRILNNMIFSSSSKYTDASRSLHIERYENHPVSKEKEQLSMVYKFASGTSFRQQAIEGKFSDNDLSCINPKIPIQEYKPLFSIENVYVYKHKSEDKWFITTKKSECPRAYQVYEQDRIREAYYYGYKSRALSGRVTYDNYQTRTVFNQMIGLKTSY